MASSKEFVDFVMEQACGTGEITFRKMFGEYMIYVNEKPVVLGISTNDGLGANARNLGVLLNVSNVYFVPFGQDNPLEKNNSLIAHWQLLTETVTLALQGKQIQPLLVGAN